MEYLPGMENLPEHLRGLALPAHLALQDAEKSNDLRKKLEARKAMTASVTQVRNGPPAFAWAAAGRRAACCWRRPDQSRRRLPVTLPATWASIVRHGTALACPRHLPPQILVADSFRTGARLALASPAHFLRSELHACRRGGESWTSGRVHARARTLGAVK